MSTHRSGHHGWRVVVATAAIFLCDAARAQDAASAALPATPHEAAAVARAASDSPASRPNWLAINSSAMVGVDGAVRDDGGHDLMSGSAADGSMRDAVNIPGVLVADGVRVVDGRIQLFSSAVHGAAARAPDTRQGMLVATPAPSP